MRTKVEWASAVALAATLTTAVVGATGSGAQAETRVKQAVDAIVLPETQIQNPEPARQVQFTSEPVVQPIPADAAEQDAAEQRAEPKVESRPATLAAYVAQHEAGSDLTEQMHCLAGAIYFESRGESLEGQLAVGRVIVNRARSSRFPSSYCGVVFQKSQFSFVRGGAMPRIRTASRAWKRAMAVARIADADGWQSPAKGALFFHAARVRPGWKLKRLAQVDNHIFYR